MDTFQQQCLEAHNKYRRLHGVPDLVWSQQVSNFSQNWANQLAARDNMQHSSGSGYGENLYMKWSSGPFNVSGNEAVDSWYNEIKDYRFDSARFSMNTGHFTQVVWKGSRELGVAKATSASGRVYVVANYSPPGNYQGQFSDNVFPPS